MDKWDVCYDLVMDPVQINGDVVNRDQDDGDAGTEAPSPIDEDTELVVAVDPALVLSHTAVALGKAR